MVLAGEAEEGREDSFLSKALHILPIALHCWDFVVLEIHPSMWHFSPADEEFEQDSSLSSPRDQAPLLPRSGDA